MEIAVLYSLFKTNDVNHYLGAIKQYFADSRHAAFITTCNAEKGEYLRLQGSKFLILLAETIRTVKAPLSPKINEILARSTKPAMYKGIAFVKHNAPFWKNRALLNSMEVLERHGIIVVYSDFLINKETFISSLDTVNFN